MPPQLTSTFLSVDDYLAGELESQVRHEYDFRQVEVFRRSDQWRAAIHTKGEVPLQSVDLTVSIDEIYRRTDR